MPHDKVIVAIVGATASGKTDISLDLADRIEVETGLKSEVVSIDKSAARLDMGVVSAAPDENQRKRVPHHMLDMFYLEAGIPRGTYQAIARTCIQDVLSREKLPMLVGGSTHLMEVLIYFDRYVNMNSKPGGLLRKLDEEQLADVAIELDFGMPFEFNETRLRNHIAARLALRRDPDRPPRAGTLVLGIHREPDDLEERIRLRTERMFPRIVEEWDALLAACNNFYPEVAKTTIGLGDFHPIVNQGLHPQESIFRRTLSFARWQVEAIKLWMPHIQWVSSADEAFERYQSHRLSMEHSQ